MNTLRQALTNVAWTENRALSYASTLKPVLDFFYHAGARRGQDITDLFRDAYYANHALAIVAAFQLRDIRAGKGERDAFRQCLRWLHRNDHDAFLRVFPLVPEYGRWDDLLEYVDDGAVVAFVRAQLEADERSQSPSLLAKWMPSVNTSSAETRQLADAWRRALGLSEEAYRKMLARLRQRLEPGLVERLISARRWGDIRYETVPGRAFNLYRGAFAQHEPERFQAYLDAVKGGKARGPHADTLYPYELVYLVRGGKYDQTVQALWDSISDYTRGKQGLVVADVSGSMTACIHRSRATFIDVAVALALYYAQRNRGPWHGLFITFSERPSIIALTDDELNSLDKGVQRVLESEWGFNTNLEAVMNLILSRARAYEVPPEEMPKALWIVSDMQFDCVQDAHGQPITNLEAMRRKFMDAGYDMPVIVFWNVASRVNEVPATADSRNVVLVSGMSPTVFRAALETEAITPWEAMLSILADERYQPVREALRAG